MYFSIRDASYWYERTGQGPAIVLLHGFTGSTKTWDYFVDQYQDDFEIIVVDLPGHGKTNTGTPRSMEACSKDLRQLLLHLGLTSVHLVGYSMGGRTALTLAMLYPDYVASLILESASPGLESAQERRDRMAHDEQLAQTIERDGLEAFVNFWEAIPLFQTQKKLPVDVRQAIRAERLSQIESGLAQSLRSMGTGIQPSWWEQLQALTIPVLLVVGELDKKFVNINKKLENRMPTGYLVIVENAGHAIHVEESDFFGKLVSEFIIQG